MVLSVINKINNKLKFLYRKNRFLTPTLRRLLCNVLIQPHFDYACSAWYPNLTKKLKNRIQTSQNKCIRFCLQLDKMTHISHKEFETLNWLPVTERFNQCINSIAFKYISDQCHNCLNEVFETAPENNIETKRSFLKFKYALSAKPTQVKWRCLTLVQPYGAKPLTRLNGQKILTRLNII